MINKFFFILFVFFSCLQNLLIANIHPDPGHFGIQAEFLYLKPSNPSSYFALEQVSFVPVFELKSLYMKEKYKPGYRVEGLYTFDCTNTLHGRLTYYDSGNNIRVLNSTFADPAFTGTLTNNEKFRFYTAELLYGRYLIDDCDFELEMQTGIQYSCVSHKDITSIIGPDQPFRTGLERSTFWGIGPEFIINCKYNFFTTSYGTLGFATDARAALLSGKTRAIDRGADNFTSSSEPFYSLNPVFNLRLGLNGEYLGESTKFGLEAGYEWIYYNRAFVTNNVSFSGPYVAAAFSF